MEIKPELIQPFISGVGVGIFLSHLSLLKRIEEGSFKNSLRKALKLGGVVYVLYFVSIIAVYYMEHYM